MTSTLYAHPEGPATATGGQSHFQPLTPSVGVYPWLYLPIVLGLMSVSADVSRMVATQKRRRRKATDRHGKSTTHFISQESSASSGVCRLVAQTVFT